MEMNYAKKYWAKQTGLADLNNYEVKFLTAQEKSGRPVAALVQEIEAVRATLTVEMKAAIQGICAEVVGEPVGHI